MYPHRDVLTDAASYSAQNPADYNWSFACPAASHLLGDSDNSDPFHSAGHLAVLHRLGREDDPPPPYEPQIVVGSSGTASSWLFDDSYLVSPVASQSQHYR